MKPIDVNSSIYIDFGMKNNEKDPKFKNSDRVRKSKYKNILAKGFVLNWSEKVFVIKKLKIMCCGPILLVILMVKNSWRVLQKTIAKTNKKEFRVEKVKKRKGDKLYGKWKCYNNSFNKWIHRKGIV